MSTGILVLVARKPLNASVPIAKLRTSLSCLLVLWLAASGNATVKHKAYLLNPPSGCTSGFSAPAWQATTSYYGVAANQLGNAWVSNGGNYYRNETGSSATSGNGGGPTCTSGTCVDGGVTWRYKATNNTQCADDIAHSVYTSRQFDGVAVPLPWSGDNGQIGFDVSNSGGTAHGIYSYTNYDALFTNSSSTGFFDNPNWPAIAHVVIIAKAIDNPGSTGNTSAPNYVFSSAYHNPPQDVAFCTSYAGSNNGGTVPWNGSTLTPGVYNINTSGVVLATLSTGWIGMHETPAKTAWEAALQDQLGHHSGVSWHAKIDYERIGGVGTGGETMMACAQEWENFTGWSTATLKSNWTGYVDEIYDATSADAPAFTLQTAENCAACVTGGIIDYTWADTEAGDANADGFGHGDNGFSLADTTIYGPPGNQGVTQGSGISGDFAYIWNTYTTAPVYELQTVTPTDPTNAGTGSLANLLPFAKARCPSGATICSVELFWQDWCTAYCPNYTNYATYHTNYASAISTYRQ